MDAPPSSPEQHCDSSRSALDAPTGAAVFASDGPAGPLAGRFAMGPDGDLSLAVRAFETDLVAGGAYPGRLDGRPPLRLDAAPAARFEPGRAADFAAGAVTAVYPDGVTVHHIRKVFFKHRDYWVVVDRLSVAGGVPADREFEFSCSFELAGPAAALEPTSLKLLAGPWNPTGANLTGANPTGANPTGANPAGASPTTAGRGVSLAVYPLVGVGLSGRIEPTGTRSRLVFARSGRAAACFVTLLHPVAPHDEPQIRYVEGIEAEEALAMRVFFVDEWIHTFVDRGQITEPLLLNWLPVRAEVTLFEITPQGDLSRRIEAGRRGGQPGE